MTKSKHVAPVNQWLVEICEVVEEWRGGTCSEISLMLHEMDPEKVSYWCRHGVRKKLLVATKNNGRGAIYVVTKNWQEIVKSREKDYKLPEPPPSKWRGINSVFDMAQKFGSQSAKNSGSLMDAA